MTEADRIRAELAHALDASSERLRRAISVELEKSIELEPDQRIQFEVDPHFYYVTLCATEEELLPDEWLEDALPEGWFERAGEAFDGWDGLVAELMAPWIADCWRDIGGPARFSPAFMFFHGYHHNQYDLELRRWLRGHELDARW